jgi:hypothetical protein
VVTLVAAASAVAAVPVAVASEAAVVTLVAAASAVAAVPVAVASEAAVVTLVAAASEEEDKLIITISI